MNRASEPRFLSRGFVITGAIIVSAAILVTWMVLYIASLGPPRTDAVAAQAAPSAVAETVTNELPDLIASDVDRTNPRRSDAEMSDAAQELALRDAFDQGLSLDGLTHLIPIAETSGVEGTAKEREILKESLLKYMLRELGKEDIPTTGQGSSAFLTMRLTTIMTDSSVVWSTELNVSQPAVLRNNDRVMSVVTWSRGQLGLGSLQNLSGLRRGWDSVMSQLSSDWRRTHHNQARPAPKPVPAGTRSRSSSSRQPCDPPRDVQEIPRSQRRRGEPTLAPARARVAANDGNWELKE